MEISKLKHLQRHMTALKLEYRNFKVLPQIHKLSTMFHFIIEEVFENLETADVDMSTSHSIIYPIVIRNFDNTFRDHNVPNKHQHFHKNKSQQYQYISYQIPRTS